MMLALAFFALATTAQAAITILYPTSQTVWYKNDTVQLNWTVSDPTTDTYLVRVFLSNQDQSLYAGNNSIVDGTNATATFVSIKLPNVPAGSGYIVNFVNSSDFAQAYATSQAFTIADGNVTTSSTSSTSSPAATAASSTAQIPNAGSTTPVFSTSSAAVSATKSSTADHVVPLIGLSTLAQGGAVVLALGLGMGMLV